MSDHHPLLGAALALLAVACHASQDTAKPATAKPAAKPAAAAPAAPAPAPAASAATALPHYTQTAANSALKFSFEQAGAAAVGVFKKFSTTLVYDEKNLAASSLDVRVDTASVDTQEQERDDLLKGADLFDAAKFPAATFKSSSLSKRPDGSLEALGKLTIRDVSHDVRLPLTLKSTANGVQLSGKFAFKRLDYGVGQGEWKATDSVGNEVTVDYSVSLVKGRT